MRVLVTGGAGFIGSNLVDELLAAGDDVTVVDNFSNGRWSNLSAASSFGRNGPAPACGRLTIIQLDLRDAALSAAITGAAPEVVFHLAGQISVRASVTDPVSDVDINVRGTVALAQAAYLAGVRKVVFASSGGSIYGVDALPPTPESAPVAPFTPYAASKVAGELYLNSFSRLHGLQCTHLAFANVYGPRQNPAGEAGVVAIFTQALLAGRPTLIFGEGDNTRDYVYVADVVAALRLAAGEVADRTRVNIGTGVETTDRRLHSLIARAVGAPDRPRTAPSRPADVPRSALDVTLAATTLGWRPRHDLESGIDATVRAARRSIPEIVR